MHPTRHLLSRAVAGAAVAAIIAATPSAVAQPTVLDSNLAVRAVVSGLNMPTSMAFLGNNDMLVLEKITGKVQRVTNNAIVGTALDLPVNGTSERGLLGIALHPDFATATTKYVYLYWTETKSGADNSDNATGLADVPLLGNRVDRFTWDGANLTMDRNIIKLRAYQADAGQPLRGNHNGGVIKFGPDKKLYIVIGDNGRRGWLQNLPCGPTATCPGPTVQDDDEGGPAPDNAHLTGVILRLNDDGTTPADNPFFAAGPSYPPEVGANIQKIFAYGVRNTFGFDFDPVSGTLWLEENGNDSFSQLSRVEAGRNLGWIQIRGPVSRIAQYKGIETQTEPPNDPCVGSTYFGLQQIRWPPTNLADTPQQAISRLFMLPGAHFRDPELSWKFEVAPAGVGFMRGRNLGPQYQNDLFMGGARTFLANGHLFHFNLTGNRRKIGVDDPDLDDRVADNTCKFDITESETLLFGTNFGVATDIQTGPNGNLFVVSLSQGAVYEIYRKLHLPIRVHRTEPWRV